MLGLVAVEIALMLTISSEGVKSRFEIAYATYLGGSGWDEAREVIPYPDGSVLIGAQSCSPDMPMVEGAFQPCYAGDDPNLGHPGVYGGDCYLARISPDGSELIAATYFGGSKQERNVYGMELDRDGNVVITSMTHSPDLPVTEGAFQARHGGGPGTIFVAKLSGDLKELLWCTYLGGSGDESPRGGLALDEEDNVYIFGTTASPDFPTTDGAYQRRLNGPRDAFVAKLKADGSELIWCTLFGGSSEDYMLGGRLDREGNVYFVGHTTSPDLPITPGCAQPRHGGKHDAYAVKLSPDGGQVLYATYLGGSGNEFPEHRPALLPDGSLLIPGVTASPDFPVTPGAYQRELRGKNDAFLTKLSADGSRFLFSTLLGGSGTEVCLMPTVSPSGTIFIVGTTSSPDLPVTPDAFQPRFGGGESDGWIAELSPDGSRLLFCSYLGGSGRDMIRSIAFGLGGEIYLVGYTFSEDFPVTDGALQTRYGGGGDAFVVKLVPRGR
ncbi:hypothetical protein DRP77_12245 [Candidatus Poribacteria bacterium]|nr:MAG: hypothetical protein DRP77_12245 [Candidatus Poribacteria bacterium]